jgi:2-hydroxychromene-2-carboxylate isomerase
MRTLEFFYDIGSPYSYLAATRVDAIAADCRATLVWRPFLVGAVFKATENTAPAFNAAKARYMSIDLIRWGTYYDIPFHIRLPPTNTLLPMRVLAGLSEAELPATTMALFHAVWVDQADPADSALLTRLVGPEAVARAEQPDVKAALRATTDEAVRRGAFGAPTFFIGDAMFFGNDRLPFVEQALRIAF